MKAIIRTLAIVVLLASEGLAQDQPVLIKNSRSPDGRMEIWIKPVSEDVGEAAGAAQIRLVKTQSILGTFQWSGFGVRAGSSAFTVLWRPNSKFFAISWEVNRGYMTGAIFAADPTKGWVEVKLPSDKYVNAIKRTSGVRELP